MKNLYYKIITFIGLGFSWLSFVLIINALFYINNPSNMSFALWIYSVILALIANITFLIDGIYSLVITFSFKAKTKNYVIEIINVFLSIITLPICVFIGGTAYTPFIWIWHIYFALYTLFKVYTIFPIIKLEHK